MKPRIPSFSFLWKSALLTTCLTVYTVLIKKYSYEPARLYRHDWNQYDSAYRLWTHTNQLQFTTINKESECLYANNSYGIYFMEMMKEDGLSLREACAIESTAILHPTRDIILLHSIPFKELNNHTAAVIENNFNIRLTPLNFTELFVGTPLQEWHLQDRINASIYHTEHMSDAVRYALLWRCGGIYSDTDAISIRSFNGLHNVIGYSDDFLAGGIMVFDRHHAFLKACMDELDKNFNPTVYSSNGPFLVSRVMKSLCSESPKIQSLVNRPQECDDITIMEDSAFYPIDWRHDSEFFKNYSDSKVDLSKSFSVHLYGKLTRDRKVKIGEHSFLEVIARKYCPKTYTFMVASKSI